jgi:hypothetical protein
MKEMAVILKCWPRLTDLDLNNNPICTKNKYRERIIVLAPNIQQLDNKEVGQINRAFLQNWKISKEQTKQNNLSSLNSNNDNNIYDSNQNAIFTAESSSLSGNSRSNDKYDGLPTYVMPGNIHLFIKTTFDSIEIYYHIYYKRWLSNNCTTRYFHHSFD